jgi:hypothetical protein
MYQARELVAQRNVFGDEVCTGLESGSSNGENQCELERHSANDSLGPDTQEKLVISPLYRIMTRHNALSLDLRAATSLARIAKGTDREPETRRLLSQVYSRFSEGFDTADLRDAAQLLEAP